LRSHMMLAPAYSPDLSGIVVLVVDDNADCSTS
jgi:hypothetical protein